MRTDMMVLLGASHDCVKVPKEETNEIHANYYWSNIWQTIKKSNSVVKFVLRLVIMAFVIIWVH